MLQADLFIGTSSGFAALANFSELPYFITHMNKESCNAYAIEQGSPKLPFASAGQFLIYEKESSALLASLLERGLARPSRRALVADVARAIDLNVRAFAQDQARWLPAGATTGRFFVDDVYCDQETAYLLWPLVQAGFEAIKRGDTAEAGALARRIELNFPRLRGRFPEFAELHAGKTPPLPRLTMDRLLRHAEKLNGNILPVAWRESSLHNVARRVKRRILGFKV
jgi:hypothetical protein